MIRHHKTFSPARKIVPEDETIGQKLYRLARASLPSPARAGEKESRGKRYCACGAGLHANAKTRHRQLVCDDCADIIPRMMSGKRPSYSCDACRAVYPRLKLKVKGGGFYCKKCLKLKYNIDF